MLTLHLCYRRDILDHEKSHDSPDACLEHCAKEWVSKSPFGPLFEGLHFGGMHVFSLRLEG